MTINSVPSNHGIHWLKEAFVIYKKNALPWTLIVFAIFLFPIILGKFLPFTGSIFGDYVQTLLGLGVYRLCQRVNEEGAFDISLLFKDFSDSKVCISILWLKGMTYLSFLFMGGVIVALNMYLGVTRKDFEGLVQIINTQTFYLIPESFFIILGINVFIALLGFTVIAAALAFASPLIAFQQQSVFSAMKLSLKANLKNIAPLSTMIMVTIPLLILSGLTLGLGFLILAPLITLALVLAYKDIFTNDRKDSAEKPEITAGF